MTETHVPVPLYPDFEGKPVDASLLKIANSALLEITDIVLGMDDIVQIIVEARVNGVNHQIHEASGKLIRLHTVKPINARVIPYTGTDDGVIRG